MHVLHINTSEQTGGAAIAASRLVRAINRHGIKAKLLVRDQQTEEPTTLTIPAQWGLRCAFLWERARIWMTNGFSRHNLWSVDIACAGSDITHLPAFQEADIIHLHWINQGLLSIRQIERILAIGKPVVWTLHDMWPVTGICHHAGTCLHYHTHCHDCPLLRFPSSKDLSWAVFQEKIKAYSRGHITFVGVSRWMTERARQSALTQGHALHTIGNALSMDEYVPADRHLARQSLGIPDGVPVIAFGAARIDLPAKGLQRLLNALDTDVLRQKRPHLLLFGTCKDAQLWSHIPCTYTYVGEVHGSKALSRLYSSADVLVNSSDYETFGQTLTEAMACGCTPVSFDCGGQTDIIRHRENGYLAHAYDINDLSEGILWAISTPLPVHILRQSAARFSTDTIARQYSELYETLL